jgi:hypothetical protein
MNWLTAIAALSATVRMALVLLGRWFEEKRRERLANLVAKGVAHDKLAKAVAARNGAAGLDSGPASVPDRGARYRRD